MAKLLLLAIVTLSVLSAALPPSGKKSGELPAWYWDYQEARSVARERGMPLFVMFR